MDRPVKRKPAASEDAPPAKKQNVGKASSAAANAKSQADDGYHEPPPNRLKELQALIRKGDAAALKSKAQQFTMSEKVHTLSLISSRIHGGIKSTPAATHALPALAQAVLDAGVEVGWYSRGKGPLFAKKQELHPLHINFDGPALLQVYLDHGFKTPVDHNGQSIVRSYVQFDFSQVLETYLKHTGVSPDEKMNKKVVNSMSPLQYAAAMGAPKCLQVLLDLGANINLPDELCGETALFNAVRHFGEKWTQKKEQLVRTLVERGIDRTIVNHEGKRAVDVILPKNAEMQRLLLSSPA